MAIYNDYKSKQDAMLSTFMGNCTSPENAKPAVELVDLMFVESDAAADFWRNEQSRFNQDDNGFRKQVSAEMGAMLGKRYRADDTRRFTRRRKAIRNNQSVWHWWHDANGEAEAVPVEAKDESLRTREEEWYYDCELALQDNRKLHTAIIDQNKSKGLGKNRNPDIIGVYLGDYEWSSNAKLNAFHNAIRWHTPAERPKASVEAIEIKLDLGGEEDISTKLSQTHRRTWWAHTALLLIVNTDIDTNPRQAENLKYLRQTATRDRIGVVALDQDDVSLRTIVNPQRREMDEEAWKFLLTYAELNVGVKELLERIGDHLLKARDTARHF